MIFFSHIVYMQNNIINIVVLSTSKIKKQAIMEVFLETSYNISFVEVPDNPNRPVQPVFIEGTKYACNQRIEEYIKKYEIKNIGHQTYIISIENGIMPIDNTNGYQPKDFLWADFCMIGLFDGNNKTFIISPAIIAIDKIYSEPYFEYNYEKKNETLGEYIARYYKNNKNDIIPNNNWMKYICGIDRVEQIKLGLDKIKITKLIHYNM